MLERPAEVNHDIRVFARSCFLGGLRTSGQETARDTTQKTKRKTTRKTT
ncbi:MAG: hypothetical protein ACXWEG_08815 [Actinomycetota bacterium]